MSTDHLLSAKLFSDQSGVIESEHGDKPRLTVRKERDEHWAYATGAVLFSVAFLEALINELFLDAVYYEKQDPKPPAPNPPNPIDQLPAVGRERMARMWGDGKTDRFSVPDKFQAALEFSSKPPFNTGERPYQGISDLITLRNKLVHFEPETRLSAPDDDRKFEKRLRNHKFALNPWFGGWNVPFFPEQCIGHGCAEWAVSRSKGFADKFCSRMGITPIYQRVSETYSGNHDG